MLYEKLWYETLKYLSSIETEQVTETDRQTDRQRKQLERQRQRACLNAKWETFIYDNFIYSVASN